jgi:hypothetical protein
MTLDPAIVDIIKRRLAKGRSARQVARELHGLAARSTISKIAAGTYHAHPTENLDDPDDQPNKPYEKCPGCLYRVQMPCRICAARAIRHARMQRLRRYALRNKLPMPDADDI